MNTKTPPVSSSDSSELAAQIIAIQEGMRAAESTAFPKISLRVYAVLVFMIPVWELGLQFLGGATTLAWLVRVATYGAIFGGARYVLNQKLGVWEEHRAHPVAVRGILFQQRFTLALALLFSYAFYNLGHPEYVFALVLLHLAFLFSSFSRFGETRLRWTAYIQGAGAFLYLIVLPSYPSAQLLPVFTTLTAISLWVGSLR